MGDKVQEYKGYAYIKGQDKPYELYGNSEEYIISRLQSFNMARTEQQKYATVNIGVLADQSAGATVKYENFKRFEVATGKDITPIYLELPHLSKEDFKQLTAELKANGAKYNAIKKKWYVRPEDAERFEKYLPSAEPKEEHININKEFHEAVEQDMPQQETALPEAAAQEVWHDRHGLENMEFKIELQLADQKVVLNLNDLPKNTYIMNKPFAEIMNSIDDALDKVLAKQAFEAEQEQTQNQEGYILDISKDVEVNECTVFFSDGQDPLHLYGDQFGINFANTPKETVQELVDNYLINQADPYKIEDQLEYILNQPVQGYAFDEKNLEFYEVKGTVFDVGEEDVMLKFTPEQNNEHIPDEYMHFEKKDLFSAAQKKWIEDVSKLEGIDYQFMRDASFTSAQMEAIAEGFKDGLSAEQIKMYADPMTPSWKMDLCRIGMLHRIDPERLNNITTQSPDWISGRNMVSDAIKEHRLELGTKIAKAGFKATPEMIRKLEHMDHLTGRENSIKDVCTAFKGQTYRDDPKLDQLVKDLGREFQLQELAMKQAPMPMQ